jgi:hypothetical protein|uniref:Uncharacterized protein n=1 Tax=Myoviridae sp. ctshb19 TaxID=2825194 RepID=A0A8S5UGD4_9CAUD|nr:MAG TPA: hypothetical protein [Myoviridae sp. ctshb19]
MKYEVFQVTKKRMTFEVGVMHHEALTHSDVADGMRESIAEAYQVKPIDVKVVGAGFCSFEYPIKCWGTSESLGISTRGRADEDALTTSINHYGNADRSPYNQIASLMQNLAFSIGTEVRTMGEKRFVVAQEISVFDMVSDGYVELEMGMQLQYIGPTLDGEGSPVQMFRVTPQSNFYADYGDCILHFHDRKLAALFEDGPEIRKLTEQSSFVIGDDSVVLLASLTDPYPLDGPSEEVVARYSYLHGNGTFYTKEGTLQELCKFFNVEIE